jgi:hypothetical protein
VLLNGEKGDDDEDPMEKRQRVEWSKHAADDAAAARWRRAIDPITAARMVSSRVCGMLRLARCFDGFL